jgi:serine/threonine protein kinase
MPINWRTAARAAGPYAPVVEAPRPGYAGDGPWASVARGGRGAAGAPVLLPGRDSGVACMSFSSTTHPSLDQLAAFDQGLLPAEESARVEAHVAACDVCCRQLDLLPDTSLVARIRAAAGQPEARPTAAAATGSSDRGVAPESSARLAVPIELQDHPRYRILEVLGAGGMGVVFKAEHRLMERTVALKVLSRKLIERPSAIERFRLEVKAAARLGHANIVTAYDAEQAGDSHFLVMEFVAGSALDRLLAQQGPLPVSHACAVAQQVALGLQHALERGMVHRDIKPANLMLAAQGQVKILDFGLARFVSETVPVEALTQSGTVVGTPDYIAPEQALEPRTADIRADIYSLGCTLYHLLAGRPPFAGGTVMQKLIAHRERMPEPLTGRRPDVPSQVLAVLDRLLAKEPARRYQAPAEIARALAPFAEPPLLPPSGTPASIRPSALAPPETVAVRRIHRRRWLVLAGGGAVAASALGALSLLHRLTSSGADATPQFTFSSGPASVPRTTASQATAPKDPVRGTPHQQALAWLKVNLKDPSTPVLAGWTERLTDLQARQQGFVATLGPGLLKSSTSTRLVGCGADFFVLVLTPEQAEQLQVKDDHDDLIFFPDLEPRQPLVQLADCSIKGGPRVPVDQKLTGTVAYRKLAGVTEASYNLHLSFALQGKRPFVLTGQRITADRGSFDFSSGLALSAFQPRLSPGLHVLFLDLYKLPNQKTAEPAKIVSNTLAMLVEVMPGKK